MIDHERDTLLREGLAAAGLDGVLAWHTEEVVLTTGKCPHLGATLCLYPREGEPVVYTLPNEHPSTLPDHLPVRLYAAGGGRSRRLGGPAPPDRGRRKSPGPAPGRLRAGCRAARRAGQCRGRAGLRRADDRLPAGRAGGHPLGPAAAADAPQDGPRGRSDPAGERDRRGGAARLLRRAPAGPDRSRGRRPRGGRDPGAHRARRRGRGPRLGLRPGGGQYPGGGRDQPLVGLCACKRAITSWWNWAPSRMATGAT